MRSRIIAGALAACLGPGAASAVTLDFSGDICSGPCINGSVIAQDYGDVAGQLDVIYDSSVNPGLQNALHWGAGYETLAHVAYASPDSPLTILFQALPGFEVAVRSFDIAPFSNRVRTSEATATAAGLPAPLLATGPFEVSTDGVTSFDLGSSFASSVMLVLGPDAFDVGISNIVFDLREAEDATVIPLPATALLLLGGLAALGALRRRAG